MSNGASSLYEKPLPGISSCGDETPKSNRKPSTPGTSAEQSSSSKSPKLPSAAGAGRREPRGPDGHQRPRGPCRPDRRRAKGPSPPPARPSLPNDRTAKGAIADNGAALELQRLKHFAEHDRFMPIFLCQDPTLHPLLAPCPYEKKRSSRASSSSSSSAAARSQTSRWS